MAIDANQFMGGGKNSGGNGGSIAALYAVLRDPALTAEMVEEFSSTNDGYAAWSDLTSVPDVFTDPTIKDKIYQSTSAYIAIINNKDLLAQFEPWDISNLKDTTRAIEIAAMSDEDFAIWVSSEQDVVGLLELSYSPESITSIVVDVEKMTSLANSVWAMTAIAASTVTMTIIAESDVALEAIFATAANRTILWDSGKTTADILMRGSNHSRSWLETNVSVLHTTNNGERHSSYKKCYVLSMYSESNSSYPGTIGVAVGDYNNGSYSLDCKGGYGIKKLLIVNERFSSLTFKVHSQYSCTGVYVNME